MEPHEIERYAEAVFRFCRKRLSSLEDARDLSQDILPALKPAVLQLNELMKAETPARLHDQIRGIIGVELGALIAMVLEQQNKALASPPDASARVMLVL
jgi:hypothetical protein